MNTRRRTRAAWSASILQILDTVCRYLLLNLLWTLSVILIVTAPGGTRAMLETVQSWSAGEDQQVVRTFLAALRRHVIPVGLQALPLAGVGILLVTNFAIVGLMGDQRSILSTALLAVAFPFALLTVTLQPALLGRDATSVRDAYGIALRDIIRAPLAAIVTLILVAGSVLVVYIQPLALLVVPAVAARLILATRTHLIHHTKEPTT